MLYNIIQNSIREYDLKANRKKMYRAIIRRKYLAVILSDMY